jgi:molybdopterin molybdotransferase
MEAEQGLTVASAGDQNTGILSTMIRAQGIVALPPECDRLEAGAQVEVQLIDASDFAHRPFENLDS